MRAHFGLGRGIDNQRVDAGDLRIGGAVGLHGVDQRIELGELAGDPHIVLGIHLAQQFGLEGGVVRQQNIQFGFGEHRHGLVSNTRAFSRSGYRLCK